MNNYFKDCKNLNEAKKLYHTLLKENHPDQGGDTIICQQIIEQFENYIILFTADIFRKDGNAKYEHFSDDFQAILNKIIHFENMKIEIIGYWIYCFNSYEYKEELKAFGFWFSKKHRAWVFSGTSKKKIRSRLTTNDIRSIHGVVDIETEKLLKIS
ncbi:hypothetical protein LCGC14_0794160 [marine sediment metagenome]|uniref:J domain-containing protein n=1 Tax=marine sediment metagenome TaxID=412755 RepID=A0A0F9PVX4_9ZZZZ